MLKADIGKLEHMLMNQKQYKERLKVKNMSDMEHQFLSSVVENTPLFIDTLDEYEAVIYKYMYLKRDLTINDWNGVTHYLNELLEDDPIRSISKAQTMDIRESMLQRFAKYIGYPLTTKI